MIHLYTGDGKGKTTAAVGLCVRAAGAGQRVIFSQFMKGNDTGELHVLEHIPNVRILRSAKQFGFYKTLSRAEKAELTDIHNALLDQILEAVTNGQCDMAVLDEITYPVSWGLVDAAKLERLIALEKAAEAASNPGAGGGAVAKEVEPDRSAAAKAPDEGAEGRGLPGAFELVFTGRDPAGFLMDSADYVTQMKALRHPFEKGIRARKGIEY